MELEQAEEVVELLNDEGYEATIYPEYSGRGMYGKTCVAIVMDSSNATVIGWACGRVGMELNEIPHRQDSMGLGIVVY